MRTALLLAGLVWAQVSLGAEPKRSDSTAAIINEFMAVRWEHYRDERLEVGLRYPYAWSPRAGVLGDESFFAAGATSLPSVSIRVLDRPADVTLEASVPLTARAFPGGARIVSARAREIGGVPVRELMVEWAMPVGLGLDLRSRVVSFFHDDEWVLITATDGRVQGGLLPELNEVMDTLSLDGSGEARR